MSPRALALAVAAASLAAACGSSGGGARSDGGIDVPADAVAGDAPQAVALDFAVTGCARYDMAAGRCYGAAPLALAFSPVSSPTLTQFLWSFGDRTPDSTARAPMHTYLLPGTYDVTLVGAGGVGTASSTQHVSVAALLAGSPCDLDAQCADGLACVCGPGCPSPFGRGLCTAICPATSADPGGACGAGAACVEIPLPAGVLRPPSPPEDNRDGGGDGGGGDAADGGSDGPGSDGGDAAVDGRGAADAASAADAAVAPLVRRSVCLATCQHDTDCPPGLACRDLPAGTSGDAGAASASSPSSSSSWTRACYPRVGGDVGQPCRTPSGALSDDDCLTGACADLGALGLCTAACGPTSPCPAGATCATFGDGRSLCVARCDATNACARDPLLACTLPGTGGPLGFTVPADPTDGGAPATAYCAPRPCTDDTPCTPAGICTGGHCRLRR